MFDGSEQPANGAEPTCPGEAAVLLTPGLIDRIDDVDFDWEALTAELEVASQHWPAPDHVLPIRIDTGAPSTVTAALLDWVDPAQVCSVEKVRILRARARMVAHHQAQLFGAMMDIVDEYRERGDDEDVALAMESAASEIRAALSVTRRAAESDLSLAWTLRERLPMVAAALRAGVIDLRRARVLADFTCHLPTGDAQQVCDRVLERAEGLTTGQVRALVQRLCIEVDPEHARDRYETSLEDRRVFAESSDAGTAAITATDLPADRVAAIMDRLTGIARSLRSGDDARSVDQIRADVFLDLLEGTARHGRRRGVVDIRIDLTTLMGIDDRAAEIVGFGPVVADVARQVAEHRAEWRVTVTDEAGEPIHVAATRRRPTAGQRRAVEGRDVTCIFPGCRMPATSCDLDHRTPVTEGGSTHVGQLAALCRHDHVIRHRTGWRHSANGDGSHTWVSPLGMTYVRQRAP
ncbi:MAG: DUF222 domain-containing protein [Acidimicrobiia bacterium]